MKPYTQDETDRGVSIAQRELEELAAILVRYGYSPSDADRLWRENIGPEELEGRCQCGNRAGHVLLGSLEYTHGMRKVRP